MDASAHSGLLHRFSERATAGGVLIGLSGLPWMAGTAEYGRHQGLQAQLWAGAIVLLVGAYVAAGLTVQRHRGASLVFSGLALSATLLLSLPSLRRDPALAFVSLLGATLAWFWLLWLKPIEPDRAERQTQQLEAQIAYAHNRGLAWAVFGLWTVLLGWPGEATLLPWLGLLCPLALLLSALLRWATGVGGRAHPKQAWGLAAAALVPIVGLVVWHQRPERLLPLLGAIPGAALVLVRRPRVEVALGSRDWELLTGRPERLLATTFFLLCLLGTYLLTLPQCAVEGQTLSVIDGAFMAVSAVCVTGLAVVDPTTTFSGFGQVCLLLLIQVGGLGIMTFSTTAAWLLGQRMSLRQEQVAASLVGVEDRSQLFVAARTVLVFTFAVELIGALVLWFSFNQGGEAWGSAAWRALFTAISAFCNAGFALQSDSLMTYQETPLVLHTVAVLIILGGLSPHVVLVIPSLLRGRRGPHYLQNLLVLGMTAALLLLGFGLFLAIEWNGSLRELAPIDRVHNAWFQSATLRTAGFNSVDLTQIAPATVTLFVAWMFIGGSPGGTAGGIKTTTVGVLFMSLVQAMTSQQASRAFGRTVKALAVQRAGVVVTVAATTFFLALTAIQLTQTLPGPLAVFEVASALGTVGLTLGGTALLDGVGKVIIAACMFIGRVGGVALLLVVASHAVPRVQLARPKEDIDVG